MILAIATVLLGAIITALVIGVILLLIKFFGQQNLFDNEVVVLTLLLIIAFMLWYFIGYWALAALRELRWIK